MRSRQPGALEAIHYSEMMRQGFLAPSINLECIDDEFSDLPILGCAKDSTQGVVISDSLGFGGHKRVPDHEAARRPDREVVPWHFSCNGLDDRQRTSRRTRYRQLAWWSQRASSPPAAEVRAL